MSKYRNDPCELRAKYDSVCPETGKPIRKGDLCVYFPRDKKTYHSDSKSAAEWRSQAFADNCGLADAGW